MALKIREYLLKLVDFLPMASSSSDLLPHHGLLNLDRSDEKIQNFYERVALKFIQAGDIHLPISEILFLKQYKVSKHEYLSVAIKTMDGTRYIILERRNGSANDRLPRDPPPSIPSRTETDTIVAGTTTKGQPQDAVPTTAAAGIAEGPPTGRPQASGSKTQREQVSTGALAATCSQPQDMPPTGSSPVEGQAPTPQDPAVSRCLTSSGNFMSFFSSESKPTREASDVVKIKSTPKHDKKDSIVGRLACKGSIRMDELITIALMVHDSELSYRLFSTNCYWFAGAITAIVEEKTHLKMEQLDPDTNLFMAWLRKMLGMGSSEKKGKYLTLPIFQRPEKEALRNAMVSLGEYEERFLGQVNEGRQPLVESQKQRKRAEETVEEVRREVVEVRREVVEVRREVVEVRREATRKVEEARRETTREVEARVEAERGTQREREGRKKAEQEAAREREARERVESEMEELRQRRWIQKFKLGDLFI